MILLTGNSWLLVICDEEWRVSYLTTVEVFLFQNGSNACFFYRRFWRLRHHAGNRQMLLRAKTLLLYGSKHEWSIWVGIHLIHEGSHLQSHRREKPQILHLINILFEFDYYSFMVYESFFLILKYRVCRLKRSQITATYYGRKWNQR